MKNIPEIKKNEIIDNIKDFNLKKLIYNLGKLKIFSEEKGKLKEIKNKTEFMVRNKLKYKNGEYSFDTIESVLRNILTEVNS